MSTSTTVSATINVSTVYRLFKAVGLVEGKAAIALSTAVKAAVEYMKVSKMDYKNEQDFKTGCVSSWVGKDADFDECKRVRNLLNVKLKLHPDYVAAIAATPKAQEMAKKRGGSKKAATNKASGKVAAIAKVIKGKAQSAPQVDASVDNIRFDHILQDVTRSVQGIHAHVQMHLKPSQLTDYNKAQTDFLIAVAAIVNK
jgi:hypothetical protein